MNVDIPQVKASLFGVDKAQVAIDPVRTSRQLEDDAFGYHGVYIRPHYDPETWANLMTLSSRLRRSVHVFARNTVGLGFRFVPVKPEDELSKRERTLFKRESDRLFTLFDNPNPEQSTEELFEAFKIDEESTGDGWLEPTRNRGGTINGLYHAPSKTMRIVADGKSYVQSRAGGQKVRHFRVFGDKRVLDPLTGKPAKLSWKRRATEMIHHKLYTPDDDWYGAPRYISASPAIATNRMSQQWNMNFLRNSAHLPYAVIVEGGNLNHESRQMITSFIDREGKGVQNAGRVLLLEPELEHLAPRNRDQIKIRLEKIAIGLTDDGSFLKLREASDEEVREVMGMPKMLLGTFTDANKANAVIALRVTIQQEIEPEIRRLEHMVNRTVVRDMGVKVARFAFVRPKILDPLQDAILVQKLMGAFSVNELREVATTLRGKRLPPIDHALARVPTKFFENKQMLDGAEKLVMDIVKRAKELTTPPGEVTTVTKGGQDGNEDGTLLPSSVVRMLTEAA